MTQKEQQWQRSRNVLTRIFITGRLVLDTPTHFGNGDTEGMTDISLLRDPVDGKRPLQFGSSLCALVLLQMAALSTSSLILTDHGSNQKVHLIFRPPE